MCKLTDEQCDHTFFCVDMDGDGFISWDEFVRFVQPCVQPFRTQKKHENLLSQAKRLGLGLKEHPKP